MIRKAEVKKLQRDIQWYQRRVDKITFVCDMRHICNTAGYYADYPEETKKFWSKFTQDCVENCDYELNHALYKFFQEKYAQLGQ